MPVAQGQQQMVMMKNYGYLKEKFLVNDLSTHI